MIKRYAIAFLISALSVGGIFLYFLQRATQLPSWYTEQSASSDAAQSAVPNDPMESPAFASPSQNVGSANSTMSKGKSPTQHAQEDVKTKIDSTVKSAPKAKDVEVQLDQREIGSLFTSELRRKAQSQTLAKAIKGANTTIQNGRIESGAVVNLGGVPVNELPSNERNVVSKLIESFPALGDRNVYIGVEGKPTVVNGLVTLGDDARIKIGNLSFTPSELSQRLGIPEDQIKQRINLEVHLGRLKVNDIQLDGDRAIVKGDAN